MQIRKQVALPQARNLGEQPLLCFVRRIERQAYIEHHALACRLDLDTGAADLLRAPV